jgi:hypothetical protein
MQNVTAPELELLAVCRMQREAAVLEVVAVQVVLLKLLAAVGPAIGPIHAVPPPPDASLIVHDSPAKLPAAVSA